MIGMKTDFIGNHQQPKSGVYREVHISHLAHQSADVRGSNITDCKIISYSCYENGIKEASDNVISLAERMHGLYTSFKTRITNVSSAPRRYRASTIFTTIIANLSSASLATCTYILNYKMHNTFLVQGYSSGHPTKIFMRLDSSKAKGKDVSLEFPINIPYFQDVHLVGRLYCTNSVLNTKNSYKQRSDQQWPPLFCYGKATSSSRGSSLPLMVAMALREILCS